MFFGTHDNKVDKKGRVSVPAAFRQALEKSGPNAIVAFPSFRDQTIEVWTVQRMQRLQDGLDQLDQFSDQQDDLASLIFAESTQINLDPEGRIMLPTELAEHAGIANTAVFVGHGATFHIWEPSRYQAHRADVRARAAGAKLTIQLGRPQPQDGER